MNEISERLSHKVARDVIENPKKRDVECKMDIHFFR